MWYAQQKTLRTKRNDFVEYTASKANTDTVYRVKRFASLLDRNKTYSWKNELSFASSLQHVCLPTYVEFAKEKVGSVNRPHLVYEHPASCIPLQSYMKEGVLSYQEIQLYIGQLLSLLVYLQDQSPPIFLRNICAENLYIHDGGILFTDLSQAASPPFESSSWTPLPESFGYDEPELNNGQEVCIQSDLYNIGALFVELCTRTPPHEFVADNSKAISIPKESVPAEYHDWLIKILSPREERFSHAQDVLYALKSIDPPLGAVGVMNKKKRSFRGFFADQVQENKKRNTNQNKRHALYQRKATHQAREESQNYRHIISLRDRVCDFWDEMNRALVEGTISKSYGMDAFWDEFYDEIVHAGIDIMVTPELLVALFDKNMIDPRMNIKWKQIYLSFLIETLQIDEPTELRKDEKELVSQLSSLIEKTESGILDYAFSLFDGDDEKRQNMKKRLQNLQNKRSIQEERNWFELEPYCLPFGIEKEDYLGHNDTFQIDKSVQKKVRLILQKKKIDSLLTDEQKDLLSFYLIKQEAIELFSKLEKRHACIFQKPWVLVSKTRDNTYETIGSALQYAPEDACLFVLEGQYEESVVITKKRHIIGLGKKENILITHPRTDPLLFQRTEGTLINLSVCFQGAEPGYCSVDMVHSNLTIDSCLISSPNGVGLGVRFQSRATIENSTLYPCAERNIFVSPDSALQVSKSTIHSGTQDSLCCFSLQNIELEENRFTLDSGNGITLYLDDIQKNPWRGKLNTITNGNMFSKTKYREVRILAKEDFF